jgi:DNA-binding transcriptional regulator YdaS (Cro superfamily)
LIAIYALLNGTSYALIVFMINKAIELYPSEAAFCRAIGMKHQFWTQIKSGKRSLPPRYAFIIEKVTAGNVKAIDLIPEFFASFESIKQHAISDDSAILPMKALLKPYKEKSEILGIPLHVSRPDLFEANDASESNQQQRPMSEGTNE